MANKPTKKTVAKKATKKETVKKATPVMEESHACGCGHECACHKGCTAGRIFKKIIITAFIFALGFVAGNLWQNDYGCPRKIRSGAIFVNGCLDMSKVNCPVLLEKAASMDKNNDGCIDKEEYKAMRKDCRKASREMRKENRGERNEMREERREEREEMREENREERKEMREENRSKKDEMRETHRQAREAMREAKGMNNSESMD